MKKLFALFVIQVALVAIAHAQAAVSFMGIPIDSPSDFTIQVLTNREFIPINDIDSRMAFKGIMAGRDVSISLIFHEGSTVAARCLFARSNTPAGIKTISSNPYFQDFTNLGRGLRMKYGEPDNRDMEALFYLENASDFDDLMCETWTLPTGMISLFNLENKQASIWYVNPKLALYALQGEAIEKELKDFEDL